MYLLAYLPNSIVDGVGLRQVVFLSGCPHCCKGCHNPESWNLKNGSQVSVTKLAEKILNHPFDVTFSGGDPLFQVDELIELCKLIKDKKNIWVYTGFTFEEIIENDKLKNLLSHIDVLVDGKFIESLKDRHLKFRGSSNQRIIDVPLSLEEGKVVELEV